MINRSEIISDKFVWFLPVSLTRGVKSIFKLLQIYSIHPVSRAGFRETRMTPQKRNTAIYIAKMITAVLLCFVLSLWVSQVDYIWALISAVLVMSPETSAGLGTRQNTVELSVIRIKGNIIGCSVGVLFLFAALENPVNIIAGAIVALFACHRFKLMAGARSTVVALIITLMQTDSTDHWGAAISRVAAVVAGCGIALFATHLVHNVLNLKYSDEVNS